MTSIRYHEKTPQALGDILDRLHRTGTKVRVFYGDTETGRNWHEENDVYGQVGRSIGPKHIPLLCHPRSHGGFPMLDHCIVAIASKGGNWVWRHPNFKVGDWAAKAIPEESDLYAQGYRTEVSVDGTIHARFKGPTSLAQADRYIAFMTGKRLTR